MLIWVHAIKIIIGYYPPPERAATSHIEIHSARMNRLFFHSAEKLFSIAFPFKVTNEDGTYLVKTSTGIEIDSRISSDMIAMLEALRGRGFNSEWDFVQYFDEDISDLVWPLLTELLDAEDGYMRFDHDPIRVDGHKHPLNHADLFYTNGATFKLGLTKRLNLAEIIDILDRDTDCHFLQPVL